MSKISYIITPNNITVNFDSQTHVVPRASKYADAVLAAIRDSRFEEIPDLVSASKRIEEFSNKEFSVIGNEIFIQGQKVSDYLGKKIVQFANESLPYMPLVRFATNLQRNPSFRAVTELYQFLEKNDHPITSGGNFIAYKKVGKDFLDLHSRTISNVPGTTVVIPRNQVNEDSSVTCSYGLHVANWDYAYNHYGSSNDIMLEVEVDPADVVAIPNDYNQSKMRVCRYVVLGVVNKEDSNGPFRDNGNVDSAEDAEEDYDPEEDDGGCNCDGDFTCDD